MAFIDYLSHYQALLREVEDSLELRDSLNTIIKECVKSLKEGLPILVCGNGGSAADAQHIAGELVGRYKKERKGLNVICLSDNATILTALGNDYGYETVFSRQVEAYGKKGGQMIGLSTSGNSVNVVKAFEKAREIGMTCIAFTGQGGGALAPLSDVILSVPSYDTPIIQQVHMVFYHYVCQEIEAILFDL